LKKLKDWVEEKELQRFSHSCPTILFNILKKIGLDGVPEFLLSKVHDKVVLKTIDNIISSKYSKEDLCIFLRNIYETENVELMKDIGVLILLILDDFETKMVV